MKVLENLPRSECHINSARLAEETSHHGKRRHGFLWRPSKLLTAQSVVYRSQMVRGAGLKCIKCPPIELYEWIKGFAKLCHKAVNHWRGLLIFIALPAEEALRAVVMTSITSFVKSFTSVSTPECRRDNKEKKDDGYSHQESNHSSGFSSQTRFDEQSRIWILESRGRMQRQLSTGGDVLCHSPWRHSVCLLQGSQALQACLHVYETICQPTRQSDPLIQLEPEPLGGQTEVQHKHALEFILDF